MELKAILEALLFSSQKPVNAKDLRQVFLATGDLLAEDEQVQEFKAVKVNEITKALEELAADYEQQNRSFRLIQIAGAWQLAAQPEFAPWIRTLVGEKQRHARLSAPALETLAIIAYRQPITRNEIEQIRGVSVDGTMQKLLERDLIEQCGKAEVIGRPSLYGTTDVFLEYLGLPSLKDLPDAEELQRIPVTRPESLSTTSPDLATDSSEQLTLDEIAAPKENTAADLVTEDEEDEEFEDEEFDDDGDDFDDDEDEEEDGR
jgi:segregation and condensation protein B